MSYLESRLRIMCQCGQPSYAGTPITPPCWACEANARVHDLTEALQLLVALPVTYNGNRIEIETGSHGEAMEIVRKARAALAGSEMCKIHPDMSLGSVPSDAATNSASVSTSDRGDEHG